MAQAQQYVLFELAAGYALFLKKEAPDMEQVAVFLAFPICDRLWPVFACFFSHV